MRTENGPTSGVFILELSVNGTRTLQQASLKIYAGKVEVKLLSATNTATKNIRLDELRKCKYSTYLTHQRMQVRRASQPMHRSLSLEVET